MVAVYEWLRPAATGFAATQTRVSQPIATRFPGSRALTALIALVLIGAGIWLLLQQAVRTPLLLADSSGRMELVVLSVNSARSSTLRNAELTSRIVNTLPEHTRILILAPDREAFTVASNPWPERISFVDMPDNYALTIWPQDPFLVVQDEDGPRLLASPEFARAEDIEMAKVISDHLGLPLEYAPLNFEGGNIVADDKFVFIGANTIRLNAIQKNRPERAIAESFRDLLGKPVIVIGPTPQPVGHIDMMLTPLGERRLMLADPGWGARIAAQELADNPAAVAEFERNCELNFFGHNDITEVTSLDGAIIRPPPIVGTTKLAIAESQTIAASLDRVAQTLTELDFEVIRLPFLYRLPPPNEGIAEGETITSQPGYPQLTYNNVLIDTVEDRRTVYLPAYGWAALDDAAARAWRSQGYRVVQIPGFTTNAMYGGALRCSVKVLGRDLPTIGLNQ
jgi:hypothetical protein